MSSNHLPVDLNLCHLFCINPTISVTERKAIMIMSKSTSLTNAKDSGVDITEYEVIGVVEGDGPFMKNYIFHDDSASKAGDDADSATSDDSTWEYVETDIHKIVTKDLWRTDATKRDILKYLTKLLDLCSVESGDSDDDECLPIKSQQDIFYRLGGYTVLIGIMNKYKNNIEILYNVIILALILSKNHPGLLHHFLYAGIIDCVVDIMNLYPDNLELQFICLRVFQVFTTDLYNVSKQLVIGTATGTATNDSTDKNTGLNAVILAMKKFPLNFTVQGFGCQILYNISYKDLSERIIDAGAIGVLAAAMEQHSSNRSIKVISRKAMIELLK